MTGEIHGFDAEAVRGPRCTCVPWDSVYCCGREAVQYMIREVPYGGEELVCRCERHEVGPGINPHWRRITREEAIVWTVISE